MGNFNQNNENKKDAYDSFMNKYIQHKKERSDKENTINELKRYLRANYDIFDPKSLIEKIENNEITTTEELDFEVKNMKKKEKENLNLKKNNMILS